MTQSVLIERITRSLAYMLRHQPEKFDLELDRFGYAEIGDVVHALNERLGEPVCEDDVREAIASGDRPRYELKGDLLRALYGHSIEVEPGEPAQPPENLYVPVSARDADRALRHGLRGGRRRFLHLALTPEDARESGRRIGREYTILEVSALDAWEEGINFFDRLSLFLAESVPTRYIQISETCDDGYPPAEPSRGRREYGDSDRQDRDRDRGGRSRGGRGRRSERDDESRGQRESGRGSGQGSRASERDAGGFGGGLDDERSGRGGRNGHSEGSRAERGHSPRREHSESSRDERGRAGARNESRDRDERSRDRDERPRDRDERPRDRDERPRDRDRGREASRSERSEAEERPARGRRDDEGGRGRGGRSGERSGRSDGDRDRDRRPRAGAGQRDDSRPAEVSESRPAEESAASSFGVGVIEPQPSPAKASKPRAPKPRDARPPRAAEKPKPKSEPKPEPQQEDASDSFGAGL